MKWNVEKSVWQKKTSEKKKEEEGARVTDSLFLHPLFNVAR